METTVTPPFLLILGNWSTEIVISKPQWEANNTLHLRMLHKSIKGQKKFGIPVTDIKTLEVFTILPLSFPRKFNDATAPGDLGKTELHSSFCLLFKIWFLPAVMHVVICWCENWNGASSSYPCCSVFTDRHILDIAASSVSQSLGLIRNRLLICIAFTSFWHWACYLRSLSS